MFSRTFRLPSDCIERSSGLGSSVTESQSLSQEDNPPANQDAEKLSTKISSKISQSDPWQLLEEEIIQNPNDITKWDLLFKSFDEKFEELYDEQNKESISDEFKKYVHRSYSDLLQRFPYLNNYWKNFLIFEYKLNGADASIDVLSKSVNNFPHSIDLWSDYMSALITQYEGTPEASRQQEQINFIRAQFDKALTYNGQQFLSHPLWDKLFEFETSLNVDDEETSREIFFTCLKVVRIPLYQYAQYYKKFVEINKKFSINDVFSMEQDKDLLIEEYLKRFNKGSVEEFSLIEEHQIIDDYSYKIFTKTQAKVNEKWKYESALAITEFSLQNYSQIEEESEKWINYLNYEIENYRSLDNENKDKIIQYEYAVNIFERALIPLCLNSKIWLKYLAFINTLHLENEEKYDKMKAIYDLAINRFIPLDDNYIRFSYGIFFMKYDKFELSNELFFDLIKLFGGLGSSKVYQKDDYLEAVNSLIRLWSQVLDENKITKIVEGIIDNYFEKPDRYTKRPGASETNKKVKDESSEKFIFNDNYVKIFEKLLNDESICVVIDFYLNYLITNLTQSTHIKIRKFFNRYYKESAIQKSVKFWKFFVEFEGLIHHNMVNLKKIIKHIQYNTQLPKAILDSFIDLNYEIVSANLSEIFDNNANTGRSDDTLIMYDNDISESLIVNSSGRKRLSNNNYIIQELEEAKLAKSQNKYESGQPLVNREEELLKIIRKHADHPGILVDHTPEISNKIMNEGNWVSLDKDVVDVPNFPTFKNVEKASLPIVYPLNDI